MKVAIVSLVRGLGQLLNAYYAEFDGPTSALINAITDWLQANDR